MSDTNALKDLVEIRARDAESVTTWFKEPALGACGRAFIDRRILLGHIDALLLRLIRVNAINDDPARFNPEVDELTKVAEVDKPECAKVKLLRHPPWCDCNQCHCSKKHPQIRPHHALCGCFECAPAQHRAK